MADRLGEIVSRFGRSAKAKLSNIAVTGAPEDQLRAPIEALVGDVGEALSGADLRPTLVGEHQISDLKSRPDYAVTRQDLLIGDIEIKAPGKGWDPRSFTAKHDKEQWAKLKALPNLLYTDGNGFSLWQSGKKVAEARLSGDIYEAGGTLTAPSSFETLFASFFSWQPQAPKKPRQLAETAARLCRLLRDEVREQIEAGAEDLLGLQEDIKRLMFPEWTEVEFSDGYAQSVTFGLLMARARGISLAHGPAQAAHDLQKTNSLIGAALGLLTEDVSKDRLSTSLQTMTRVLDAVDWPMISKGNPEAWLYFYEEFLQSYDKELRKATGSYYTPTEVVDAMVKLTDEALRTRFGRQAGLASHDVKLADPAVGTGTFLLSVLRKIAAYSAERVGPGAVAGEIEAALERMVGFELQFGPFAVAQLRMLAEIAELTDTPIGETRDADLRLYVADTLADFDESTAWIPTSLKAIGASRQEANRMKRSEPITVVIGNPPYKVKAKSLGGWVADRGPLRAPIDDWMPPAEWGAGAHAKHLHNFYVYF